MSTQWGPPLISALTSGRYHIKWTQLADLPVPLYSVYTAVHHHKIYVSGMSSVEDAYHQVYVYNIDTNQWGQLPPSGHCRGVPHIINDRLTIIGGVQSATKMRTNKVSTFDEDNQTWTSYYPDLLSVRSQPGVVSHLEHVIVAGGRLDDNTVHDDIEVLNWMENPVHWRRVAIKLPVPMCAFTPTVTDDHIIIVGFYGADKPSKAAYKLPVADIIASIDQRQGDTLTHDQLLQATHILTTLVPNSSPSVIVGGWKGTDKALTADIKMYDNSDRSWKKIGSLSSTRCAIGIAAVHNSGIIVIGGCTKGDHKANCKSSSLKVVELGQAELLQ